MKREHLNDAITLSICLKDIEAYETSLVALLNDSGMGRKLSPDAVSRTVVSAVSLISNYGSGDDLAGIVEAAKQILSRVKDQQFAKLHALGVRD